MPIGSTTTRYFINSSAVSDVLVANQDPDPNARDSVTVPNTFSALAKANANLSVGYTRRLIHFPTTGETRYIVRDTAGTGTTRILTLSDDMVNLPATGAAFHVAYHPFDVGSITGSDPQQSILIGEPFVIGTTNYTSIQVTFTTLSQTMVRVDGQAWVNFGYSAGMRVTISGSNAGTKLISAVSGSVITFVAGSLTVGGTQTISVTNAEFPFLGVVNSRKMFLVDPGAADATDANEGQLYIKTNGRLESGYLAGGQNVSGGVFLGRQSLIGGSNTVRQEAGSTVILRGTQFLNAGACNWVMDSTTAKLEIYDSSVGLLIISYSGSTGAGPTRWRGATKIRNLVVDSSARYAIDGFISSILAPIEVDASFDCDGLVLASSEGLTSLSGSSSPITVKNYSSVNPTKISGGVGVATRDLRLLANITWRFIDPRWSSFNANEPLLEWTSQTNNGMEERYSLNATVTDPVGSPIQDAVVTVVDEKTTGSLQISQITPYAQLIATSILTFTNQAPNRDTITRSSGSFITSGFLEGMTLVVTGHGTNNGTYTIYSVTATVLTLSLPDAVTTTAGGQSATLTGLRARLETSIFNRLFDNSTTTTTFGPFRLKIFKYGRLPVSEFLGALTGPIVRSISLAEDAAAVTATSATAISNGESGTAISVVRADGASVFDHVLFSYDTGTGLFVVGETVTGGTSGAAGTVRSVLGDATSGALIVQKTSALSFTNNEALTGSSAGAALVNGAESVFTWGVNANGRTLSATYDYLAAKMAVVSPSGIWAQAVAWGTQLLQSGPDGFFTERGDFGDDEGVIVYGFAGSIIDYYTDDAGNQVSPPRQVTVTFAGVRGTSLGDALDSELRIYRVSDDVELTTSAYENVTGDVTFSYFLTGGTVPVYVHILNLDYKFLRLSVTLTMSDQTVPVFQVSDVTYSNP